MKQLAIMMVEMPNTMRFITLFPPAEVILYNKASIDSFVRLVARSKRSCVVRLWIVSQRIVPKGELVYTLFGGPE